MANGAPTPATRGGRILGAPGEVPLSPGEVMILQRLHVLQGTVIALRRELGEAGVLPELPAGERDEQGQKIREDA